MNDLQKRTAKAIVNIFETGHVRGDYGAVTVLKGDSGHLTYGRSQTTLGSGNLFLLIKAYCERSDARYAADLDSYLTRLHARDVTLDKDLDLRELLREAGRNDSAMKAEQDRFFDVNYFDPACKASLARDINSPLGQTVVYDSFIQGGFAKVTTRVPEKIGADGIDERQWIGKYVSARKQWLLSLSPPLPDTVYRMDSFAQLIKATAWDLPLPLTVRSCIISEETLDDPAPVVRASAVDPADPCAPDILYLKTPYMQGPAVRTLQETLNTHGFVNNMDGVFGPFTNALVKQFQKSKQLRADGVVGPQTYAALGL
ncbi:MAG: peptidoglycan-binding protein [Syntrophobacteraceae bacterium]